jgi:hypothetical protein
MGVAIWHTGQNEKPLQTPLPIPHCALRLRQSTPKEISARRNRVEGFHNEGRKRAINCGARLRRVKEKFIVLDKIWSSMKNKKQCREVFDREAQ